MFMGCLPLWCFDWSARRVLFAGLRDGDVTKGDILDSRYDFANGNKAFTSVVPNEGLILEFPQRFKYSFQKKPTEKVSKLKEFFKSCLELITYKDAVAELSALIK